MPDLVFGNLLITITVLNAATGPIVSLTIFMHSFEIVSLSFLTPVLRTTRPIGNCPFNLSATPNTAHSATDWCSDKTSSIAPVDNL